MNKDLKDKAIDIKGTDYVLVKDRIIYFNENYLNGSINTELISDPLSDIIVIKATVIPDCSKPERQFSDYSQAVKGAGFINKTAALENASTSAVGRCLSYLGIGVIDSVASADEINKAQGTDPKLAKAKQDVLTTLQLKGKIDFKDQLEVIERVLGKQTIDTVDEANQVITELNKG